MANEFTLGPNERLKSRKRIEQLFREGKPLSVAPIKILYLVERCSGNIPADGFVQFAVSAPVRVFKKAVARNRIKRLIKESYRLQKKPLQQQLREKSLIMYIFFIYTGNELPEFNVIKAKVGVALNKLEKSVDEVATPNT